MQNTVVHVVAIGRSTGGAREKNTREKCQQSRQNKTTPSHPSPFLAHSLELPLVAKEINFLKWPQKTCNV